MKTTIKQSVDGKSVAILTELETTKRRGILRVVRDDIWKVLVPIFSIFVIPALMVFDAVLIMVLSLDNPNVIGSVVAASFMLSGFFLSLSSLMSILDNLKTPLEILFEEITNWVESVKRRSNDEL